MSRSLTFSRQSQVHKYLNNRGTLCSAQQVRLASRFSTPGGHITCRVSALGQTSLTPFRNGIYPIPASNRGSLLWPSLKMIVPRRATHHNVGKGGQTAFFWGTNAGRDVWKISGGTTLVFAAAFGGAFVYCENRTEGEFCSKFREHLGLKKK